MKRQPVFGLKFNDAFSGNLLTFLMITQLHKLYRMWIGARILRILGCKEKRSLLMLRSHLHVKLSRTSQVLKTLFNIVEAPLIVELWCLWCILMFRRVNKQSRIQKYSNSCCYHQDIYDWISPLNKQFGSLFILPHAYSWVMSIHGISGHLHIFLLLFLVLLYIWLCAKCHPKSDFNELKCNRNMFYFMKLTIKKG